jgi:hypothetical protein
MPQTSTVHALPAPRGCRVLLGTVPGPACRPGQAVPLHPEAVAFPDHYDFTIDVLAAYRPTGKGRVERQVRIVRDHVLAARAFFSIEELDRAFLAWVPLRRRVTHRTHGEVIRSRACRTCSRASPSGAQALTASADGGQALVGALDDALGNEFGQCGEDVEDEAAAGGGGVEGLLQGPESDAAAAQIGDDRDEVLEGASEPVERGDDEGVAGPQVVQGLDDLFPVGVHAAQLVGEDADAAGGLERAGLPVQALIASGDPGGLWPRT